MYQANKVSLSELVQGQEPNDSHLEIKCEIYYSTAPSLHIA